VYRKSHTLGQKLTWLPRPLLADIVAKVFLGERTKLFRAPDAFYERRRERPYRFIQNQPGISAVALKSDAAAEKSKNQLSRDFPGRSIFDFCNTIGAKQTTGGDHKRIDLARIFELASVDR
jgi:hypothetical protein